MRFSCHRIFFLVALLSLFDVSATKYALQTNNSAAAAQLKQGRRCRAYGFRRAPGLWPRRRSCASAQRQRAARTIQPSTGPAEAAAGAVLPESVATELIGHFCSNISVRACLLAAQSGSFDEPLHEPQLLKELQ